MSCRTYLGLGYGERKCVSMDGDKTSVLECDDVGLGLGGLDRGRPQHGRRTDQLLRQFVVESGGLQSNVAGNTPEDVGLGEAVDVGQYAKHLAEQSRSTATCAVQEQRAVEWSTGLLQRGTDYRS